MVFPFYKELSMKNEKNYGLVRHMDRLGRIVIPKEIRNQLDLHMDDALEIGICGRSITVQKYQKLQTLETLCEQCLSALAQSYNTSCLICGTENVIASRGINLSKEHLLSHSVMELINNMESYHYSDEKTIFLFRNSSFPVDTLYPIGTKDTPIGAVIYLHYRKMTETERVCAKLLADLLTQLTINK
jgi:AbrB family looped-hinge helix DNA binding protein